MDRWGNEYYRYVITLKDLLEDEGINPKNSSDTHHDKWRGWKFYLQRIKGKPKNIATTITKKFIEILIDNLIDNNAIYMLPNGIGCIAIAQRPIESKYYVYEIKYKQARPVCYILLSPKGWKKKRNALKIILSKNNWQRVEDNIKKGFIYMTYERLLQEVGYDVRTKKDKNDIQSKIFRSSVYKKPSCETV